MMFDPINLEIEIILLLKFAKIWCRLYTEKNDYFIFYIVKIRWLGNPGQSKKARKFTDKKIGQKCVNCYKGKIHKKGGQKT